MVVFVGAFVIAILIFAGIFGGSNSKSSDGPSGEVVVWGILPEETMQKFATDFNVQNLGYTINYSEHKAETFNQELIVALADGVPPSLVVFSSEIFSSFKDKLFITPYESYSQRTFFDTNVEGAKIFLSKDGVIASPLVVDPMVVYYNKDILYGANIVNPPTTWGELQSSVRLLTKKDAKNTITQSTIGLGTTQNINNLREILSAMFLQTGNPIVSYDINTDTKTVTIEGDDESIGRIAEALDFYTSFSNPTNANYSWNSSFPNALNMFLSGKLAFYIGKSSELFQIREQNPNLNFDAMELFKTNGSDRSYTYGSFVGVGMLKSAPNPIAAYTALKYISSKESIDAISKSLSLPPVRRDLILIQQKDPYVDIFFRSALSAFSWPDDNYLATEAFFRGMIRDVTSGKTNSTGAIYELSKNLQSNTR